MHIVASVAAHEVLEREISDDPVYCSDT